MKQTPHPTPPRRLLLLAGLAAILGLVGGAAAWLLVHLIAFITNGALFGRVSFEETSFTELTASPRIVVVAVIGAFAVTLLARWAPAIRGHGIPEAMEAVLTNQSRIKPRVAIAKPAASAIAIGTGGPFGAEGPIIVTGGAIGSLIGQVIKVSPSERKILLASGAAAGMAATFGAPLAAVVLALELLLFEFSTRAFVPLVVATSVAGGVHALLFGSGPLFTVPEHDFAGLALLPIFMVVGLLSGLLAVVLSKGLFLVEEGFRRLPVGEFWHPVVGAVAFASLGLFVPRALGVGYDAISDVLLGRLGIATLATLLVAKLVIWWIALGSGTSGGTLAPILLIGGSFGALLGASLESLAPGLGISAGAVALVAMAATFGAATRATFAAIVFLFELTRDYDAILPLMLATVVATMVAQALMGESLMTEKLSRRGLVVRGDYQVDVLSTLRVSALMSDQVVSVAASGVAGDARAAMATSGHGAFPLADDDGRCVGIVTRGDLIRHGLHDEEPLVDIASTDLVLVRPDTMALQALQLMLEEEVEHLPVVAEDGVLVGMFTRTDLMGARRRQMAQEQPQPRASTGIRARLATRGADVGTPPRP